MLKNLLSLKSFLIIFCVAGILLSLIGVLFYTLYTSAPSDQLNSSLSGWKISQIEPPYINEEFLYFGVNCDPPLLYFNFGYSPLRNGTHITYMFFPFQIINQTKDPIRNGGEISIKEYVGDLGSLIIMNATVEGQTPYHSVQFVAEYEVNKTFMMKNKGDLRIFLPFGDVSAIHVDEKIRDVVSGVDLSNDISFNKVEVYVGLPVEYNKFESIPSLTNAPTMNPFSNEKVQTFQWVFSKEPDSIHIFAEDSEENGKFQSFLHWSGLLTGIGLPLFISSFVELIRLDENRKKTKEHFDFGSVNRSLILVVIFSVLILLVSYFVINEQNSLSVEILKGFLLSATAGLTGKFVWDQIKSPNLKAYSTKPAIQPLSKNAKRGFYKIKIRNESNQIITKEASKHSRVKMTFMDSSRKELFSLVAKWDWTPEPLKYQYYNKKLREIVDPSLIPISEFVDINPNDEEIFCAVMKYDGEDECFAFSGFSYRFPLLKNPRWKLDVGKYVVKIELHSSNSHKNYFFKLVNDGKTLGDVSLQKIN